jgi:hypothetical protein
MTAAEQANASRIRLRVAVAAYYLQHHGGPLDRAWSKAVDYFAEHAVARAPRTVHRWLDGSHPIPDVVDRAVDRIVAAIEAPI